MITAAVTVLCFALGACVQTDTIWSASSASPGGRWIATAHTTQYTGSGNDGVATVVELGLKRLLDGWPKQILGFVDDGPTIKLRSTG